MRGRTDCKLVRGPDGAGAAVEGVQCSPLDTVGRDRSNPQAQPCAGPAACTPRHAAPSTLQRAEFNSADGRLLAVVEEEAVRVLDAESGAVVMSMPRPQVQALSLSPKGTFLLTWEKLTEGDKTGNLMVWATATGELVTHYVCKVLGEKSLWPLLK